MALFQGFDVAAGKQILPWMWAICVGAVFGGVVCGAQW
jgi:hypothetical protein